MWFPAGKAPLENIDFEGKSSPHSEKKHSAYWISRGDEGGMWELARKVLSRSFFIAGLLFYSWPTRSSGWRELVLEPRADFTVVESNKCHRLHPQDHIVITDNDDDENEVNFCGIFIILDDSGRMLKILMNGQNAWTWEISRIFSCGFKGEDSMHADVLF